uniref:Uncharacterized protein n=1 Tax=Anguilla anguilla TaxID=7936 RepID=A0A0E9UAE9_ANGAN
MRDCQQSCPPSPFPNSHLFPFGRDAVTLLRVDWLG